MTGWLTPFVMQELWLAGFINGEAKVLDRLLWPALGLTVTRLIHPDAVIGLLGFVLSKFCKVSFTNLKRLVLLERSVAKLGSFIYAKGLKRVLICF